MHHAQAIIPGDWRKRCFYSDPRKCISDVTCQSTFVCRIWATLGNQFHLSAGCVTEILFYVDSHSLMAYFH